MNKDWIVVEGIKEHRLNEKQAQAFREALVNGESGIVLDDGRYLSTKCQSFSSVEEMNFQKHRESGGQYCPHGEYLCGGYIEFDRAEVPVATNICNYCNKTIMDITGKESDENFEIRYKLQLPEGIGVTPLMREHKEEILVLSSGQKLLGSGLPLEDEIQKQYKEIFEKLKLLVLPYIQKNGEVRSDAIYTWEGVQSHPDWKIYSHLLTEEQKGELQELNEEEVKKFRIQCAYYQKMKQAAQKALDEGKDSDYIIQKSDEKKWSEKITYLQYQAFKRFVKDYWIGTENEVPF